MMLPQLLPMLDHELAWHTYFQFWWIPTTNMARVFRRNITSDPASGWARIATAPGWWMTGRSTAPSLVAKVSLSRSKRGDLKIDRDETKDALSTATS